MFLFCSHHLEGKNVTLCRRCHPEGHFLLSHTMSQQKASLKLCAAQVTKRNFFLPAEVLPPSLERLVTGVFWPNAGKCQNSQTSGLLDELKSKLHARVCRLTCSPSILDDRQLTCSPLQRKIRKFLIFGFSNKVTKSCTLTCVRRRSLILLRASANGAPNPT